MTKGVLLVNVFRGGLPADGAGVTFTLVSTRSAERRELVQKATGSKGSARLRYDENEFVVAKITVAARNYWTVTIEEPKGSVDVVLEPFPKTGPAGWWHSALNIKRFSLVRGSGVRIGVIDEGVGPHPALAHVRNLGCMEGVTRSLVGGEDSYGHGTHVAGIIAARPQSSSVFWGIAPGADVLAIKVKIRRSEKTGQFDDSPTQDSIAEALQMLVEDEQVDLVNLSFGALEPSRLLAARIKEAFEQGVICLCAAGNDGREQLRFPAADEDSIAVASVGKANSGTANSPVRVAHGKQGNDGFFLAGDSNYGPKIACCAPGVQIISTAPNGGYVDMSGTSMAAPAACGALASQLARDQDYAKMPRDSKRAEYARTILEKCCADIGLPSQYQGNGLIQA